MQAADAGATLQAFNIYDNVVGGTLDLSAQAKDAQHPHDLSGHAHMDDFRVIKAPALATLVSVISPMGLPQLLSSQGIHFTKLESDVLWAMRRKGDVYVVTNGRTSGNSLGLTFAGNIDKQKDEIDITGDVVPVSEVNGLINHIPAGSATYPDRRPQRRAVRRHLRAHWSHRKPEGRGQPAVGSDAGDFAEDIL